MATGAEKEYKAAQVQAAQGSMMNDRARMASAARKGSFGSRRLRAGGSMGGYSIGSLADDPVAPTPKPTTPVTPPRKRTGKVRPTAKSTPKPPAKRPVTRPQPSLGRKVVATKRPRPVTPPRPTSRRRVAPTVRPTPATRQNL